MKYEAGKEKDIIIMPVELLYAEKYLSDPVFAEEYAKKTIGTIRNKVVSSISFPLGKRPLKINTVFSLDGFRVSLSGKSGGGKQLIMSPLNPFSANNASQNYLHHIDTFVEKCNRNSNLLYDADHDKVNKADNIQLYDLYIDKLTNSIYRLRPNNPLSLLINSRDRFSQLDVMAQTKVLQSVHSLFGRASGGTDLSMLGGAAKAGVICPASTLSNWKKNYSNVYIIDCSSTGMWEKKTGNLLELL